ncbi:AfsR/SARP family transcriptional regulator [Actinomadura keratinilytica]
MGHPAPAERADHPADLHTPAATAAGHGDGAGRPDRGEGRPRHPPRRLPAPDPGGERRRAHVRAVGDGGPYGVRGRETATAAECYRRALDLWDGHALVDVRLGPILEIEVMRLEESRLGAVERRIDADLQLGRHCELLAELADLTARHPHHEGLHSQAMVALYRAGRQGAALESYRRLRLRLIEELGVEPSPQLQRLHQAMLTVDPLLDVAAGPRRTSTFDLFAA